MRILVITTGGTIGALAYDDPSKAPRVSPMPTVGTDYVKKALESTFSGVQMRFVSLEPRDSKDVDDAYMKNVISLLKGSEEKVIITFGTDKMLTAAEIIFNQSLEDSLLAKKAIILTGAMIPLANGKISDGYLNLEFSLKHLLAGDVPPGVSLVLCDYDNGDSATGQWSPQLYPFQPGLYQKLFADDSRYNRLKKVS